MISEALKSNSTLTTLDLNGDENWRNENDCKDMIDRDNRENNVIWTANRIEDSGAIMISESLKTNTTLTKLYLSGDEMK